MKSWRKFFIGFVFYCVFLHCFHTFTTYAQKDNYYKVFSGQVLDTDNEPIKGIKVFFEGFNNISAHTDANGNFELRMPATFSISAQTTIYVGNQKVERSQFAYNPNTNVLVIKLKDNLPEGSVRSIEFFDEKNQPLPAQIAVSIKGRKFRTDNKGQIVFAAPPYFASEELDNTQISVPNYEVTSTYYTNSNHRFFVYLKSVAAGTTQSEIASPSPVAPYKPRADSLSAKASSALPIESLTQDFNSVINELELEKQFLNERSNKIRSEIERIATRLSSQQLSEEEKNELRRYLNRLEKQLIENDLAYESAQEKIKLVIERMRQEVISKDSLNAAAAQKIAKIAEEKEAAIREKEAVEALYRARALIAFIIFVALAGAAIASYVVAQKLKKQKEEIILQRNSIEEKSRNLEKAYLEIQSQKNEIERQNHQITTSIRYAESIQNVILPLASTFQAAFKDHFVYYRPKDIVSGDFYWCYSNGTKTLVAVVDCTGHGVPGAFMSLIGYNLLNEQVKQNGFCNPSQILENLDKNLRITLRQEEKVNNDSMDVGICLIEGNQVCFAGAKRALLIYRSQAESLEEIRGDKKPIGGFKKDPHRRYQDHYLTLQAGDAVYLFTDGITDQPNPSLEKFGYQRLKELILQNGKLPMQQQKELFVNKLEAYRKGAPIRDDMTLLAVRIG
ncbi:MAG: SpoIIE family protein phosphatase [Cytophagales bacterium]|nr:SpoIIE family protein phosphatase [Bernardetiaceae bacterium]MDW8204378.1 SpoIIE family protein phosphatase [Cytophagales bacterium]